MKEEYAIYLRFCMFFRVIWSVVVTSFVAKSDTALPFLLMNREQFPRDILMVLPGIPLAWTKNKGFECKLRRRIPLILMGFFYRGQKISIVLLRVCLINKKTLASNDATGVQGRIKWSINSDYDIRNSLILFLRQHLFFGEAILA